MSGAVPVVTLDMNTRAFTAVLAFRLLTLASPLITSFFPAKSHVKELSPSITLLWLYCTEVFAPPAEPPPPAPVIIAVATPLVVGCPKLVPSVGIDSGVTTLMSGLNRGNWLPLTLSAPLP